MQENDRNEWQVDSEKGLITHRSGFQAEFKGDCIYGIKHFATEATIRDIRDMVVKAEQILSRLNFQPDSAN
ncbi:MAG: hypothetical protein KZQ84_04860 [Candidatus Thiodiazotropha sp. (ex Lucinoma borealis)]|nr:hypothetical protein [Candidatus Thiodiazotropha sp. (ex Lucinoma borealis)]